MIAPKTGASLAVFREDKVLLVRRSKGAYRDKWSLPGGGQHADETMEETARRELHEETGLRASELRFVEMHEPVLRDADGTVRAHYVLAVFAATIDTGEPVAGDDAAEVRWADIDALDANEMTPHAPDIIGRAHAMLRR